MMMSLAPTMKSTGVLLLVLVAIACTAVDAWHWGFRRRRCGFRTANAVCRVTELPGTVNPVSGIISLSLNTYCGYIIAPLAVNVQLQGFPTNDSVTMHDLQALTLGDLSNGCASLGNMVLLDFGNLQEAADGSVNTTITVPCPKGLSPLIGRGLVIRNGTDNAGTPVGCCVVGRAARSPWIAVG